MSGFDFIMGFTLSNSPNSDTIITGFRFVCLIGNYALLAATFSDLISC